MHAQELGFRTIFIEDCSRGIDPNDIKDTLDQVRATHGVVINSSEVSELFSSMGLHRGARRGQKFEKIFNKISKSLVGPVKLQRCNLEPNFLIS